MGKQGGWWRAAAAAAARTSEMGDHCSWCRDSQLSGGNVADGGGDGDGDVGASGSKVPRLGSGSIQARL